MLQFSAQLGNPGWRHPESLCHVIALLTFSQLDGNSAIAASKRAKPTGKIHPELNLVGHWGSAILDEGSRKVIQGDAAGPAAAIWIARLSAAGASS
jgi:hypothetical protein